MFEFFKKCQCKNENLFKAVVEAARSSLDIEEVQKIIVNTVGKELNADRCFVVEYDEFKDEFSLVRNEYLSSGNIISYKGVDVNKNVPYFTQAIKNKKTTLVNDGKICNGGDEEYSDAENEVIKNYKVNSLYNVPLLHQNRLFGALSVSYTNKHFINNTETELINSIANQIAIAIYHANLYKQVKSNGERERLLLKVTEKIRSSLDVDEILSFICGETAKLFGVQRSAITSFIKTDHNQDFIIRKEYKLSPEIKGYSEDEEFQKAASYLSQAISKNGIVAIDNIQKSDTPEFFREIYTEMGVKSLIGVSIKKGSDLWGVLVLSEYNNYRNWSDEEKNLIITISNQIYIAVNQAELHQAVQNTAEHEKILRDIMLSFVKTLEMEDLVKNIVTQTGQLMNADRCFFISSDAKTSTNLPVKGFAEYLSSPEIKSHTMRAPLPSETSFFVRMSEHQRVISANVDEANFPEATRKFLADDLSVKSFLIAPVFYGDIRYGAIVLHYVKNIKNFTDDEINIMLAVANQAAIVIHHVELYQKIKQQSEREKLLREIIETIRNSIDIERTKKTIVDTMGKILNADRCFMVEYDKVNDMFTNVEYEYLSSSDINGYKGVNPQIDFPVFAEEMKKGKDLLIQNGNIIMDCENQDFYVERQSLQKYGLDSGYVLPLYYKDELLGILAIHYVKGNHIIKEDEIELLQTISSQIAIALHQSALYSDILVYSERERISKNIIEILRSSIDKAIIKKLFVKNIGKFFDADRVFFVEYDSKGKSFTPVDKDSEYLSNFNEISFVGIDLEKEGFEEYSKSLLEKREVKIYSIEEYINEKQLSTENRHFLEKGKAKSSYSFPITYQNSLLGNFTIEFTQKVVKLSDEEINRIRNMCTQAGVALYHAALYEDAQKCFNDRESFVSEYSEKIKEPTDKILDNAKLLAQNEFERTVQVIHLNQIINACNQLLELTKNLSEDENQI